MATVLKRSLIAASVCIYTFTGPLSAAEDHEHHSEDPHVHGLAELLISSEKSKLQIQFESPAANLVGFEHQAHSEDDRKKVASVKQVLESPDKLFQIKGLSCTLAKADVNVSALVAEEDAHEDHDKDHDDHAKHEDEHNEHDKEDEHKAAHSEIKASYSFNCSSNEKLTELKVLLFEQFSAIEKINAQWVTEDKQGAVELSKNKATINF